MTELQGFEFGWDGEISQDSVEFTLLPEGEYKFTVEHFERGRSKGEGKLPPCNMAVVTIVVDGGSLGKTTIKENFVLHSSLEWKLSSFFSSLGMKGKGEKVKMNWPGTVKKQGYLKLKVEEYAKKDGSIGETNRVDKYIPFGEEIKAQPKFEQQQMVEEKEGFSSNFNFGGGFK